MSAKTKKLAILFADISGSTALYETLGDELARKLISRCLGVMQGALDANNGTLIKTIGDEILCTFPTAEIALNAACDMQQAVKTDNKSNGLPLFIRIGFHYGDVLLEDNDIHGDAVNVASRVAAITRASQIMTTTAVVDALPFSQQDKVRKVLRADFKGKQEQQDIYQVMWEQEDMTSTRIGMSAFRKPSTDVNELKLIFRAKAFIVNDKNKKLLLGRDDACQIAVKNEFSSRQHANIELRFGKFVLTDHSSNGTYIRIGETVSRLNRDDTILHGEGAISLGQPFTDNPADEIIFLIKANA